MEWSPLFLSLQLAVVTTFLLWLIGTPIALALSRTKSGFKPVIEAVISLPLVLPPTVLGFYLLVAFSPTNAFGHWVQTYLGIPVLFSFNGLIIASMIYSLPFMIHPLQAGFSQISPEIIHFTRLLDFPWYKKVWRIYVPQIKKAMITGAVLTFAHTIGEFGVVLMIGGNIPNQTRVVSIAIYDEVEQMNYAEAHVLSLVLLGISFAILTFTYYLNYRSSQKIWRI